MCAAVFIIVFVCIMMAWWVHKRKQDFARQDAERAADANVDAGADADGIGRPALAPFCIDQTGLRTAYVS